MGAKNRIVTFTELADVIREVRNSYLKEGKRAGNTEMEFPSEGKVLLTASHTTGALDYKTLEVSNFTIKYTIENMHIVMGRNVPSDVVSFLFNRGDEISGQSIMTFKNCMFEGVISPVLTSGSTDAGLEIFNTTFESCVFKDMVFVETKISSVTFASCEFENTSFQHCRMRDVDFTGTMFIKTKFSASHLTDCMFGLTGSDKLEVHDTKYNAALKAVTDIELRHANVASCNGLFEARLSNFGTYRGHVRFYPTLNRVYAGCWEGSFDAFVKKCASVLEEEATKNLPAYVEFLRVQFDSAINYFKALDTSHYN